MWTPFRNFLSPRAAGPSLSDSSWILVPLGNPGDEYATTRHNLGRLLLQRWMDSQGRKPNRIQAFRAGNLYRLDAARLILVPSTYMNLSGQVCAEAAAAGFDSRRMVLLHDDKDLPLGLGRFRLTGGSGGHKGLSSVFDCLGTQDVARLRLGIGPFQRPLDAFVLGEWTEEEWRVIDALEAPFSRWMELLAQAESLEGFPSLVNAGTFWARTGGQEGPALPGQE